MDMRRVLFGLGVLIGVWFGWPAVAAPPPNISMSVATCDPYYPTRCMQAGPFTPDAASTVSLAVTTASGRVALGGVGPTVVITNNGATDFYVALGGSTVTATTSGLWVGTGRAIAIARGSSTYIAAITASSTSTLIAQTGTGTPALSGGGGSGGGGGGGVVTNAGTFAVQNTTATPAGTNIIGKISQVDSSGADATDTTNHAVKVNVVAGGATGYAQASTTAGQVGPLQQGAVTTASPTYTTGQTNPTSLDVHGAARILPMQGDGTPSDQTTARSVTCTVACNVNSNSSPYPPSVATYSYTFTDLALATSATDFVVLTKSNSNVVVVQRVVMSCKLTGATSGIMTVSLIRRSAGDTTGTSTTIPVVQHDSGSAANSMTSYLQYTVNPGGLGGVSAPATGPIYSQTVVLPAATTPGSNATNFDYNPSQFNMGQPIIMRANAQAIAINANAGNPAGTICSGTVTLSEYPSL